jgi:hypothetical protein
VLTYKLKIATGLAIAVALSAVPVPARANGEALVNIFGAVIEQGMRQQVQRQRMDREQQRQDEQERREQERMVALIKRIQSDLEVLGFYEGKIDGSFGPNTQRSMSAFQRAFRRPAGEINQQEVEYLSQIAPLGFRSADEMGDALSTGFPTRAAFVSARAAGFSDSQEFDAARRAKFATRAEFMVYQQSGFASAEDYRAAKKGGFTETNEFQAARDAGFAAKADYTAFVASGLPSKAEFAKRKAEDAKKAALVSSCLGLKAREEWLRASSTCLDAVGLVPDNAEVRLAAATATGRLGAVVDKVREDIGSIQARIDALKPQARKKSAAREIATLTRELARSEASLARVTELQLLNACVQAGGEGQWEKAAAACRSAANASPDNVELRQRIAAAEARIATARAEAETEKQRLALERTTEKAAALIAAVDDFSKSGAKFSKPLDIARLLVRLEQVKDGTVAADIEAAGRNLQAALDTEAVYAAYLTARSEAVRQAELDAAEAARSNAERLNGFVQHYVSANMTSPDIAALLALHEALTAALSTGDLQALVTTQKDAADRLSSLGLAEEAEAYRPASAEAAAKVKDDAAAQRSTQIAIDAARKDGDALLLQVAAFTKQGGRFGGGLDTVRAIVNLKTAHQDPSGDALVAALNSATVQLRNEPAFLTFAGAQQTVQVNASNDALVIAGQRVDDMLAFIADYAAANPLAPEVVELLDLQAKLASARVDGSATAVIEAEQRGAGSIDALDLMPALEKHRLGGQEPVRPTEVASNGLALTDANRALLEGEGRDILILVNASPAAPHVRVNLAGKRVFEDDTARYCWMQAKVSPSIGTILATRTLYQAGAGLLVGGESCAQAPAAYDAILFERGAFLAGEPAAAKALVATFETGGFQLASTLSWSELAEADKARQVQSETIRTDLLAGKRTGFGLIRLSGNALPVCVVPSGSKDAAIAALDRHAGEVADLVASTDRVTGRAAEDVFQASRRGECSAVLASSEDLRMLVAGFDRESVSAMLVPIWFEDGEIGQIAAELQSVADATNQAATRNDQTREGEATLAREQQQRIREAAATRQRELRERYSQEGRAAFNQLDDMGKAYFQKRESSLPSVFPATAAWWSGLLAADWELETYGGELTDYGTADWKGRRVEAVLTEVSVQSRNRALGEYKSTCRALGFLIDAEFGAIRDAVELECADPVALKAWKTGHDFETRWTVER